jgi:hypothetical protein
VDTVDPEVNVALGGQVAIKPAGVFVDLLDRIILALNFSPFCAAAPAAWRSSPPCGGPRRRAFKAAGSGGRMGAS